MITFSYTDNTNEIATTSNPLTSMPQKSIFASLMTTLPLADKDAQMRDFDFSSPSQPAAIRRRAGTLAKRPAPRDRPTSFDLDDMTAVFAAGPGAQLAQEEEEHAFRHAKSYVDANADQEKTTLAFSNIGLGGKKRADIKAAIEKRQKQKKNPFYQAAWNLDEAIHQLQTCLVACQAQTQKWCSTWAPGQFHDFARSSKGKARLASFTQSLDFMSDFLIEGRTGWSENSWNISTLREMEDLVNETLLAAEKLVDAGIDGGMLKGAIRPLRRMRVRVRELADTAGGLEEWRQEQLGLELAAELERQNGKDE